MSKHYECNLDDFIFNRLNMGFYVDVGANDGVHGSNTLTLEQRGWSGLCIEPLKRNIELLRRNRKCKIDESWLASTSRPVIVLEQQTDGCTGIVGHASYGGSCKNITNEDQIYVSTTGRTNQENYTRQASTRPSQTY